MRVWVVTAVVQLHAYQIVQTGVAVMQPVIVAEDASLRAVEAVILLARYIAKTDCILNKVK